MLLGALITSALVIIRGFPVSIVEALLLLATSFISILLFSRPLIKLLSSEDPATGPFSERRKEVGFGATLMLLGTLLSAAVLTLGELKNTWPVFFLVLLTVFALLLTSSRRLMEAVRNLLTGKESHPANVLRPHLAPGLSTEVGGALPPAQGVPVSALDSRRDRTGEVIAPPSVTERTTNLLENKYIER